MRLEKIIVNGFKSFADRTEFSFNAPITAIVGPNGCGKSNVVDAVKWVLGEQKVKSLRSDHMIDVIFSGSSGRKPAAAAEVTIVFSNVEGEDSGRLPIETDQVAITRKVFRSGDSEYRINGKTCRLKDIKSLFMDTGVGTSAYSIIEQGQIDQMLAASPADRRVVFEEAAGISKYKSQKKEATRKLERTEQNLLRLADILAEVEKRLRSVKLQAGKARNYLQYSQRLKELQVNYSLVEYARYDESLRNKRNALDEANEKFGGLAAEVARADSEVSQLAETILDKEHRLSEAGNRLVSAQSRIDQHLQRIEFLKHRIEEMNQRKVTQQGQIDHLREQSQVFAKDLKRYESERDNSEQIYQEKRRFVEEAEETVRQVDGDLAVLTAELEDEKSGIIDIVRRTAQLHNEVNSLSNYRSNLSNQKDRLATRAESARAELENVLAEKSQHQARLRDVEKVLEDLEGNLATKREQIESLETGLQEDRQRLAGAKEVRSALKGELAVLVDMENRFEGLANAVKGLLKRKKKANGALDYIDGILAERIDADMEVAHAVEAALDGLTDALVITERDRLMQDEDLRESLEGRVNFVFCDTQAEGADWGDLLQAEGVVGSLLDRVRFAPQYQGLAAQLLGRTLVVESLQAGMALSGKLAPGQQCVTLTGQVIRADGAVCLGPLGKATGLISRKSRMKQLDEAIAQETAEITHLEAEISKNQQNKEHLAKLCKDLRTAIYEANTEKMQVGSKVTVFEQNVERLRKEEPLIAGEIDQLAQQIDDSVKREYESQQKLEELEVVNNERKARIAELETQRESLAEERQVRMGELTELKIELGQLGEKTRSALQMIQSLQSQVQASTHGASHAANEVAECERQAAQAERDILSCESGVSELFVAKEAAQTEIRGLREEIDTLTQQQKETEQAMRHQREAKAEIEACINDLRVELGQLEVKQQDLIERVSDELQINLIEAFEDFHQERNVDWEEVKQEINDLRSKIERLGNVNLDAIEEQESLEERHLFLTTQVEDLNQSRQQLEQLIAKLNKMSREKFVETFDEIRKNFQEIFRKLFGGGKADIILEEAEDVLDAGIDIVARPPGKETRSITLLSGGEKSMTAMALLFAVFRSKPSPFCFLDEVDAALDEANNERFNYLISEYRADTQFVVVTHSKRTMSIAEVLFGVTMQSQGVSKKISVRFDEYEDEAAA